MAFIGKSNFPTSDSGSGDSYGEVWTDSEGWAGAFTKVSGSFQNPFPRLTEIPVFMENYLKKQAIPLGSPSTATPTRQDDATATGVLSSGSVVGSATPSLPPATTRAALQRTTIVTMVGPILATTQLHASVRIATRTITAADGQLATAVETTTLSGELSVYTTITTVRVTNHALWQPPTIVTLTNVFGQPTKIITSLPAGVIRSQTTQTVSPSPFQGPAGVVTVDAPISTVKTISSGTAIATVTEYLAFPAAGVVTNHIRVITPSDYIIGTFLPVLLAIILSLWIEAVDSSIKLLLPFHALTRPGGASASDSLCLDWGGVRARLNSFRLLRHFREPLSLLSDLLVLSSAVLIAVSSEAVGMKLHGACSDTDFRGCTMSLGVFLGPTRAVEVLLVFMAVILGSIILSMPRFRCGVTAPPWGIAGMASLLCEGDVRRLIQSLRFGIARHRIEKRQFIEHLAGYMFALKYSKSRNECYMAVVRSPPIELRDWAAATANEEAVPDVRKEKKGWMVRLRDAPMAKSQAVFLLLLCGLLAVILYYKNTRFDTPFERFMDDQHFGVKFLFTALGVGIVFFWDGLFSSISQLEPYRRLSHHPQLARDSILTSPGTSPLVTLFRASWRGHIFITAVALASILAKFTPLLLSNIPFRITQTWMTHVVTAWMTVGVLCFMILVILLVLTTRWPTMPVMPNTIAGSVYYVCDSLMLLDLEGMAMVGSKKRRARVEKPVVRYKFGEILSISGTTRTGVDYALDPVSLQKEFLD